MFVLNFTLSLILIFRSKDSHSKTAWNYRENECLECIDGKHNVANLTTHRAQQPYF